MTVFSWGMDEWIRLPKEGEKCPHTGLSRTSLNELLNEADPETGEKLVRWVYKKKPGAKEARIKLIDRQSLLAYLDKLAASQNGLRFASNVANPLKLSLEEVLNSREDFNNFLNPDFTVTEDDWICGEFETRRQRLRALIGVGVVVRDAPHTPSVDEDEAEE
jgi:hypothetical protein